MGEGVQTSHRYTTQDIEEPKTTITFLWHIDRHGGTVYGFY
jgi:hypothetical protein